MFGRINDKHPFFGKKHTENTIKKMKINHKGTSGKKYSEESVERMSGENNHRWIKDRNELKKSEDKRLDSAYMNWRRLVYKRDSFKCKINNSDCISQVEAHHILPWRDYIELRYDVNNGITLCKHHHPRKYSEEQRLSPYFKELISKQ